MAIKYEYRSPCCNHFYIETRNAEDPQVITQCNFCGQKAYELIQETPDTITAAETQGQ